LRLRWIASSGCEEAGVKKKKKKKKKFLHEPFARSLEGRNITRWSWRGMEVGSESFIRVAGEVPEHEEERMPSQWMDLSTRPPTMEELVQVFS
jgi:hypothetical protein